ncbi:MAG: serine hydrolase domain-containing protein [Peptococcaceae bacterium]|nr:serine hydrolase domain-containing protein [Peptococcaceae bacterium]
MKKKKGRLSLFMLILFAFFAAAGPALAMPPNELGVPADDEDPKPLSLQEKAEKAAGLALTYGGATSLRYALVENGRTLLSGGAGVYSKDGGRAPSEETLYGIGSVSKVYTTSAVMLLVQQGKVELDAPITRYLDDFTMADERFRQITPRMLLNHSSGLMGSTTADAFLFDDKDSSSKDSLLADLATQRLKADPGAYSVYCNDGFTLAEILVERVSGLEFTDFLHRYITGPLGLKETFTPRDDFDAERLAKIYLGADPEALPQESLGIIGTGGVYASAQDLAAFGYALCPGRGSLLSPAALQAMAAEEYKKGFWPQEEGGFLAYGLGWDSVSLPPFNRSGIQALYKGGDTLFYHASLVVLPEYGLSCAVVSSGGSSTLSQLAAARILIDALAEKGISVNEEPLSLPEAQPSAVAAKQGDYAGYYGSSSQAIKIEVAENGELYLSAALLPDGPSQTYRYYSDGSFRDETGTLALYFIEEKEGRVYLKQLCALEYPGLGFLEVNDYAFEKLPANPMEEKTAAAWRARAGKTYLLMNEKYSSQIYFLAFPGLTMPADFLPAGYFMANRITGEDAAESFVQIPGNAGRDGMDFWFFRQEGTEYIACQDSVYAESGVAHEIWPGPASLCTILQDGRARWFRTGKAAGKMMTVDLPEKGAFYVYDQTGVLVSAARTGKQARTVLPENGWIVFAGDPGQRFSLTMSENTAGSGQETDPAVPAALQGEEKTRQDAA